MVCNERSIFYFASVKMIKSFLFAIILCIIANFSATSSCFSSNASNKDREIKDSRKLNVMQSYIQRQMYSSEYDLSIQPEENNLKTYEQQNKTLNTSSTLNVTSFEAKVPKRRRYNSTLERIYNEIRTEEAYGSSDL